jgi:hypothetical protein
MSTSQFTLVYDGEGLRGGEMDVRELAPALLGVGELFEEANRELNQQRAGLSVRVKAGFRQGSFVVDLTAHQNVIEQIIGLIKQDPLVQISALVMLLFGGRGLFDLLMRGKGEKPQSVTKLQDGNTQVVFKDSQLTVTNNVFQLYESPGVRKAVRPVVKPLENPGIEDLKAIQDDRVLSEITKGDLLGLTRIEMDERVVDESEGTRFLQVVSVSFKGDNKWRLAEGGSEAFYSMEDPDFRRKIEQYSEKFGKDDMLKCKVKTTTRVTEDGSLKTEHAIVKVLEHHSAAHQTSLFPRPADQP